MKQSPSSILMVRPNHFGFNPETAQSNAFQKKGLICENHNCRKVALAEFESFVALLKEHKIEVFVFDSPSEKEAPDAVFPNNWISLHEDGKVILYPMLAENRRIERRLEIVEEIKTSFHVEEVIDLSEHEQSGEFLEGTGSIVFDHINRCAYANDSDRTNRKLFFDVCERLGYEGIFFKAVDENGKDIYHTNVMMTVGIGFAVICKEAIDTSDEIHVINKLRSCGLDIIEITYKQMSHFAGNMIQLQNSSGENYLAMSQTALGSLSEIQITQLARYVTFIPADIHTIESIGGGSARCMIAGIHLQRK